MKTTHDKLYNLLKVELKRAEISESWTKEHQEGYVAGLRRAIKEVSKTIDNKRINEAIIALAQCVDNLESGYNVGEVRSRETLIREILYNNK
jgi:hypothetical protein